MLSIAKVSNLETQLSLDLQNNYKYLAQEIHYYNFPWLFYLLKTKLVHDTVVVSIVVSLSLLFPAVSSALSRHIQTNTVKQTV